MPGLTVTEKEHWKDRISRRIDKRIEALSAEDPNFMDRIKREARERAFASLGLAELQQQLDEIERQKVALQERETEVGCKMLAQVRGVPAESIDDYRGYRNDREITGAINKRQAVHEDQLLAACQTGRQILALRREKTDLIDAIWLASSPKEIRTFWCKVSEFLGDEQSQLQRDALAIEPTTES